jgi:quercetin dioxygenase-like cupin family protein
MRKSPGKMTEEPATETVTVQSPDELEVFEGDGFGSRILADETVGVENVSVGMVEFDPSASGSRHIREVEEIVVVLEGAAEIVTDDETYSLSEGDAAIIPPGVHHSHRNVGDDVLRKLWIFAPQGPEQAIRNRGSDDDPS